MADRFDVVELRVASGRWPAGTEGTVVEVHPEGLLIEIADEQGRTQELLPLPQDAVRVLPASAQETLAV